MMDIKSWQPGAGYRWSRRLVQLLSFLVVVVAPFLGGWQRMGRYALATWDPRLWELGHFWIDRLPEGKPAQRAYELNEMMGGGAGAQLLSVPFVDPVAGFLPMVTADLSGRAILAWGLTAVLAVLLGRVYCGWLCPFGLLARISERLRGFLPGKVKGYVLPARRPLRWAILGGGLLAGAVGFPGLLYFFLPHVLTQQSVYGLWLLGGGGAALGAVGGLLLAGFILGPTAYCATLCPTGAGLNLLGRKKFLHLSISSPTRCGAACRLCDSGCWLGLKPSTGRPGPDCDLCARCTEVCPRANMSITRGPGPARVAILLAAVGLSLLGGSALHAEEALRTRPGLLMEAESTVGEWVVGISVVDIDGVRLSADIIKGLEGTEISVFLGEGGPGPDDERGVATRRTVFDGGLTVEVQAPDGTVLATLPFDGPNHPISTPRRSIYRQRIPNVLHPGDRLIVAGAFSSEPLLFELSPVVPGRPSSRGLYWFGAAALAFFGLISLALAVPGKGTEDADTVRA